MYEDLSIVSCSYNTPEILELCLKSFVFHHGKGPHKVVIVENSTNSETQSMLDLNNVPYIKNPAGTHSTSIDLGLDMVKTKYALLIDTDLIFNKNIDIVFVFFKQQQLTLLGEVQGDRGGFLLYPRVAPYFCLIDMEAIRLAQIKFHDEHKIALSHSEGFFKNIPLNFEERNQRFYDVGSVFYESVQNNNFGISNYEDIREFVFHAESLSWAMQSGIECYREMGKERQDKFYNMAEKYNDIEIKNCFKD